MSASPVPHVDRGEEVARADVRLFIGGEWVEARSGRMFATTNPATGERLALVHEAGDADVDAAVRAARQAFEGGPWPHMAVAERSRVLHRIGDLIEQRREELARLETLDTGKPIRESLEIDVPRASYNFHFFADLIKSTNTEFFSMDGRAMNYVLREPTGVAALITPWNLPLYLATWKVAPCLAAGNTCVLKPAELTPLTAARLADIGRDAGLPPGVLNVVQGFGPQSAGEALSRHPDVDLISFTGETATGRAIMAAASSSLKRLSFELGGKGAVVVFADADLEQTLPILQRAAFQNQGEVCLAGSRILAEAGILDALVERLAAAARVIRLGDPLDPATEMGALISQEHREKVAGYVRLAAEEGAHLHCGGGPPPDLPRGNFYLPTVITGVNEESRVCCEEIFGPVVTVQPFREEQEAVRLVNATQYGLSNVICTRDLARAHRVAAGLRSGIVWINCWMVRDLRTPFGGYKKSGIGREGGRHSLEFFTEAKTVCVKL
ncbi:MAG TPA: aldehyde dehydrogenase [Terriglobales bacterium]|nr:aldehyde dehydrogenase [Terriglobales bacterium]